MRLILLFISLSFFCLTGQSQDTLYVKHNATGSNDGSSWINAFTNLQHAINSSSPGDELWVAAGTYFPTEDKEGNQNPGDPRTQSFHLKAGIAVYGGFTGTENARTLNPFDNPSILSGNIGNGSDPDDNVYHVMYNSSINTGSTSIDGFRIEQGFAGNTTSFGDTYGGGLVDKSSEIHYSRIIFRNNRAESAGGVRTSSSSSTFVNCEIRNNQADSHGGGFTDYSSQTTIRNCIFDNNQSGGAGGGYFGLDAQSDIAHCRFKNNNASRGGGLMLATSLLNVSWAPAVIRDIICENNTAPNGSGASLQYRPVYVSNIVCHTNTGGAGLTITGHAFISNALIHDNPGGGVRVGYNDFGNNVNFYNSTITDNTMSGNEFESGESSSSTNFYNSIINGKVSLHPSASVTYDHCLIPESKPGGVWNVDLGTDAGGNLSDTAVFFSETDPNFRLWKCSPGVDDGDSTKIGSDWLDLNHDNDTSESLPTDASYHTRVTGSEVDMGAFEYSKGAISYSDSLAFYSLVDSAISYKWIDCSTQQVISTDSAFSHQGDTSMHYALIVEKAGCSDTSTCIGVNSILSQHETVKQTPTVEIYPNPVDDILHIAHATNAYDEAAIYSLSGVLLRSFNVEPTSQQEINLRNLPSGIYILQLSASNQDAEFHIKIVKR